MVAGIPSGEVAIAFEWACQLIAGAFVVTRLKLQLDRQQRPRHFFLTEALLVVSFATRVISTAMDTVLSALGGLAVPYFDELVPTRNFLKAAYVNYFFYFFGIFMPKYCLISIYSSLVLAQKNRTRIFLYFILAWVTASVVATFFIFVLWCRPISENWSLEPGACSLYSSTLVFQIHAALDVSCDVWVFIFPYFLLHKLQLRRKEKFAAYGVSAMGALTIALALSRLAYISVTVTIAPVYMWSAGEFAGSIIVICLPAMRPLLKKFGVAGRSEDHTSEETGHRNTASGVLTARGNVAKDRDTEGHAPMVDPEGQIMKMSEITVAVTAKGDSTASSESVNRLL
ncbi:Hypothetical protein D9617_28g065320 [Elsinoe fawcettii]|nr:Hypothetical protein D9617_28g065320 [Elsinoe fawcettii]